MVVLTIIECRLAAMLVFINNSEASIPKSCMQYNEAALSYYPNPLTHELPVEVINSKDGTPVEKQAWRSRMRRQR